MNKIKLKTIIHATLLFILFAFESHSQVQILRNFSIQKNRQWTKQKEYADSIADKQHFLKSWISNEGIVTELQQFDHGYPIFYQTENINAASTISSNLTWAEYGFIPGLSGVNTTASIWDGGYVLSNHQEFLENSASRVFQHDQPSYLGVHATHLSGTMIAKGQNSACKGMAKTGTIYAYDFNNDLAEMASEAADGMLVSNHSYGPLCGWSYNSSDEMWYWHGDLDISVNEDLKFGLYNETSHDLDFIAFHAPEYLIVKSAGNDRNDAPQIQPIEHYIWDETWQLSLLSHDSDGGTDGFDCLSPMAVGKNILTVGAVEDMPNGYTTASEVQIAPFSSFGPTDDGRIKPDLVANGVSLLSCGSEEDSYLALSGTSMSAASITGSVLLLNELQEVLQPSVKLKSSTIKALLIHTADECGSNPGPDYQYGWGLANILEAVKLLKGNHSGGGKNIIEASLAQDEVKSIPITISENTLQLRGTICWIDPSGEISPYELNNSSSNLINNLDIKIINENTGQTFYPWVLNPTSPFNQASKGINNIDNVEQVLIEAPTPGEYVIKISHQDYLKNSKQDFSLIISGIETRENLYPPANLTYYTSINEVHLHWEQGEVSECDYYNIYRNGQIIATTSNLIYDDQSVQNGTTYSYYITAAYSVEAESIATNTIRAKPMMPKSMPYTMNCESGLDDWSVKAELSGWRLGDSDSLNCYYLDFSSNAGHFFGVDSYTAGEGVHVSDMAISPPINMANYENIMLSFDYILITGLYGTTNDLEILYRLNEASDWITISKIKEAALNWTNFECTLSPDAAVSGFQIGYKYDDNYKRGMGAGLDNIKLSGTLNITEDISLEAINAPVSPQCISGQKLDLSITIKNTGNTIIQSGENLSVSVVCNGIEKNANQLLAENILVGASRNLYFEGLIDPLSAESYNLSVLVTWSKDQNLNNNKKDKSIVINPLPEIVFISPPDILCEDSEPIEIVATPIGGTFESNYIIENKFDPSLAGLGDHQLIYTYEDNNLCINSESITISVIPLPEISFSGLLTEYCVNDEPTILTGEPSGGTFIGPGIIANSFDPKIAGTGTHQIAYQYSNSEGCSNTALHQTTVYEIATLSFIDLDNSYCINSAPIELTALPEGGVFSINNQNVEYLNPMQYELGSIEITYTFVNDKGCLTSLSKDISIYTVPNVSISDPGDIVCFTDQDIYLEAQPPGGYFLGDLADENIFNPISEGIGSHEIIYTYSDVYNCQNSDTIIIRVEPLPEVSFTGLSAQYCINETSSLLSGIPIGGTFRGPGIENIYFNPTLAGGGTTEVTYSFTDQNGCSNSSLQSTIVNDSTIVELLNISESYCQDSDPVLLSAIPEGGIFYINDKENDQLIPTQLDAGQVEILYTYINEYNCYSTVSTRTDIIPLPETSILGAQEMYCLIDENYELYGLPEGGEFILNDEIISQINPKELGAGSFEISYKYTSAEGCIGITSEYFEITSNPEISINGLEPQYCPNSETILLEGIPKGGYFEGEGIFENNFSPESLVPGEYLISYTYNLNGCDISTTASTTITENTIVSIEGLQTEYCPSDSLTGIEAEPHGGYFEVIPVFEEIPALNTYDLYYSIIDDNNCSFADSGRFQVYEKPDYAPPDGLEIKEGETITLELSNTNLNYFWSEDSTSNKTSISGNDYECGDNTLPIMILDSYGCVNNFEIKFSIIGITSLSKYNNSSDIKIYPNPAENYIIIELLNESLNQNTSITIFDLNGIWIDRWENDTFKQLNLQLDISHLVPGIYLIAIENKDSNKIQKISVMR